MTTQQASLLFPDLIDPLALDASDASDGWYTPPIVVTGARRVMGAIDLDPASCSAAQAIVQAGRYYTVHEDGLSQPWSGHVWCNPPYSDPLPWVDRMVRAYQAGDIVTGMMLVNCSCSPRWAQQLWRHASAVCLFGKRLNFWHPTKMNANNSYDRDSALFYFGPDRVRFVEVFGSFGVIR